MTEPVRQPPAPVSSQGSSPAARPRRFNVLGRVATQLGVAFLVVEAALLGYLIAGTSERRVHLTPDEGHTNYQLHVFANGRFLTSAEVVQRYRLPIIGRTTLTPEGLRSVIRSYQRTHVAEAGAYVRLHARHNGGEEQVWLWPQE